MALRRWQPRHEALGNFLGLDALVAVCRDRYGSGRIKDDVLIALCDEAIAHPDDQDSKADPDAALVLCWLHLPGLWEIVRELGRWNALASEDLEAELLAGFWEAASEIGAETRKVSARLVNRARWRGLAACRVAIGWETRAELLEPTSAARLLPSSLSWNAAKVIVEAVRRKILTSHEARLVLAPHRDLRAVAEEQGLAPHDAYERRYRLRRRLRAWVATFSEVPPANLLD